MNDFFFLFQVRVSQVLRFISICDLFTDIPSYVTRKLYLILTVKTAISTGVCHFIQRTFLKEHVSFTFMDEE
jgi:hypothetical protein